MPTIQKARCIGWFLAPFCLVSLLTTVESKCYQAPPRTVDDRWRLASKGKVCASSSTDYVEHSGKISLEVCKSTACANYKFLSYFLRGSCSCSNACDSMVGPGFGLAFVPSFIYTVQPATLPKPCPPGYRVKMGVICKRYPYCSSTDAKCRAKLAEDMSFSINKVSEATLRLVTLEDPISLQDRLKCKNDTYSARTFECVACTPGKYTLQKDADQRYECDACEPGRTSSKSGYFCDSSVAACDGVTAPDEHAPFSAPSEPQTTKRPNAPT